MSKQHKDIRVAVLAGGNSPEREVSLRSGTMVAEALKRCGYNVAVVDPILEYRVGCEIFSRNECLKIIASETDSRVADSNGERGCEGMGKRAERRGKSPEFTASALNICRMSDVVFLTLHGGAGENGMIAAVLECNGIPHTGSGFRGMSAAMDKLISKRLMESVGLLTPEYSVYSPNCGDLPCAPRFPCVVKPIDTGSSVGVRIVDRAEELRDALEAAVSFGERALIERRIFGREFTVGVLNGETFAVTEIMPKNGFYDYENKYVAGRTEEITPANVDGRTERRLKDAAIQAHNALFLGAYSRVDMIIEQMSGDVYVLEVNALPGMTETSLLPQGAAACGICFDDLCERMLRAALI